jgi:hypothetical protein
MMLPSSMAGVTTQQVGYFACDLERFVRWLHGGLDGHWTVRQPKWASLAHAVADLELGGMLTRYACVRIDGWTVLLSNGPNGTDVGVLPSYAARELGCRAIRAVCVDDEAKYPARILEVYSPAGEPPLAMERSIVAANDGGRWVFETSGTPLDFENQSAYRQRVKASRFSGEMLTAYLQALGVPTDAEPDWGDARLLERSS